MDPFDQSSRPSSPTGGAADHPQFVFYPSETQVPGEQLTDEPGNVTPPPRTDSVRSSSRLRTVLGSAAAALLAVVVGGGAIAAVKGEGSASASTPGAAAGQLPGRAQGAPAGGPGVGGMAGETHVSGTVTAVAATSIGVRSTDGTTTTYSVDSSTQVLDDGQAVSVTSLKAGDTVLVHVIPGSSGSASYAERVLAGSSATEGPGAPMSDAPGTTA